MVTVAHGRSRAVAIDDSKPEFWVPELRTEFDKFESGLRASLSNAIALGKRLIEAKAKLPHGEFGRLFSDHRDPVANALPLSSSLGRKLMSTAQNPAISNRSHANVLPADLEAVYQLSLMAGPALEAAIERGDVRPDMKRAEAKQLVAEQEPREKREDDGDRKVRAKAAKSAADVLEELAADVREAIGTALIAYPSLRKAIAERVRLIAEEV